MYASSSALRWKFTSTTDASSFAAAAHTSKNATSLGSMIATRSPAPTPRSRSVTASRRRAIVELAVRLAALAGDEATRSGSLRANPLTPDEGGSIDLNY